MAKDKEVSAYQDAARERFTRFCSVRSGSALRAWRKKHALTQEAVAKLFALSTRTIIRYEKCSALPPLVAVAIDAPFSGHSLRKQGARREREADDRHHHKVISTSGVTVSIRRGNEPGYTIVF
jgi:DNA-binding XRE family transcriptional regulator